jgi:hypothetical protein
MSDLTVTVLDDIETRRFVLQAEALEAQLV